MQWFGDHEPTAIVTGGASGIGKATCELLAKDGYRVAVADRDRAGAEAVAHAIDGYAFAVDVADEASVIALFEAAAAAFDGRLDALATPAGIAETTPFLELTPEIFRRVNEINVVGTFLCIRAAAKRMREGGRICTVASVAGKRGGGLSGTGAYAASKGAVLALSRSAARALAPQGIAVNCVAPGPTLTPMLDRPFSDPNQKQRVESMTLLGRSGDPREIAEAIAWLLSPRSSYVVGETVTVDGGLMLD
ncbi:short-chain dehydrogenase [Vulcanimicrobium alpinum]|uniref:Short-chain dehydrogenase n=1 Tax=Vulcanimicrobium alpinum TaxID=3016050 RepID=A0AAN2C8X5_UNVUL|nr:SDR family NAD(P)-dependent oxidoreductase [Vulcanimicrobium alpinum]BDE05729.1 short-chain dehydrogenase [Vulcanimicrobium alpinum]